jgi:hypothetical protein
LLGLAELEDHAASRSNFSSEFAVKKWFASNAMTQTILIAFVTGAIIATIFVGWPAGIAIILGYAVLMRPRSRTVELAKQRMRAIRR